MGLTPSKKHSDLCLEIVSTMYNIFVCLPLKSSGLLCYLEKARVNVSICKAPRVSIELCHTINFGVFDFVWIKLCHNNLAWKCSVCFCFLFLFLFFCKFTEHSFCFFHRNFMNDSFRTNVFVRYHPETIGCACIFLSARQLGVCVPFFNLLKFALMYFSSSNGSKEFLCDLKYVVVLTKHLETVQV